MAEQNRPRQNPSPSPPPRKQYRTPTVQEYGHVAKLTQSGGSTMTEAGNPNMRACL